MPKQYLWRVAPPAWLGEVVHQMALKEGRKASNMINKQTDFGGGHRTPRHRRPRARSYEICRAHTRRTRVNAMTVSALVIALNYDVSFGEMVRSSETVAEMIEGELVEVVWDLDEFRTLRPLVPATPLELPMMAPGDA